MGEAGLCSEDKRGVWSLSNHPVSHCVTATPPNIPLTPLTPLRSSSYAALRFKGGTRRGKDKRKDDSNR